MNLLKLTILTSLLLLTLSCKKSESGNYTNGLTFGTSISYTDFTLIGAGTSFSKTPGNIAYRLESDEDFNNNPVKFVILKGGIQYCNEIFSSNPKPTGHIFMTTLNYSTIGTYSVTAYIQKSTGDKVVASGTFQIF